MSAEWLTPMPSRNRSGYAEVSAACPAAVSAGSCIHRLRIPVATVVRSVASRSARQSPKMSPPTPPGTHSAAYPSASSSAAASRAAMPSPYRRAPLQTPVPRRSMARSPEARVPRVPSRSIAQPTARRRTAMDDVRGRVAVITGDGSGSGRAPALAVPHAGAIRVMADIGVARAEAVEQEARAFGVEAAVIRCDVTSDDDFTAVRDQALRRFGRVDIVMNNASVIPLGRPETLPMDAWQQSIDVNLLSIVRSLRLFLPGLLEQGTGHVVNTASTAGVMAYAYERLPYSATKFAVVGLSEALALYTRPKGVGVTCLVPGPVATNISEQM